MPIGASQTCPPTWGIILIPTGDRPVPTGDRLIPTGDPCPVFAIRAISVTALQSVAALTTVAQLDHNKIVNQLICRYFMLRNSILFSFINRVKDDSPNIICAYLSIIHFLPDMLKITKFPSFVNLSWQFCVHLSINAYQFQKSHSISND